MKKITTFLFLTVLLLSNAQNIDDNKVSFKFIQLPLQKINPVYTKYEVRVDHAYKTANQDSVTVYNSKKEAAQKNFDFQYNAWLEQKKIIDRQFLMDMANYEKATNAGTAATLPTDPVYPMAPIYSPFPAMRTNTELNDEEVSNNINLNGFDKGLGGFIINLKVHPIRNVKIIETKKGSGASITYEYKCQYVLPIEVKIETPTEGVIFDKIMLDDIQYYSMKSYKSKYEYQAWWMDNESKFYLDLERDARKAAFVTVNQVLNNQFGFTPMMRETELYAVKKFKKYDYSDVTKAYTATMQALMKVQEDRFRKTAMPKLDAAIGQWKDILGESNLVDGDARVNDKVSAMIYCNLAELLVWKGDFDNAEMYMNLAMNAGVMKFRNHAERVQALYADQRKRWEAQKN